MAFTLKIQSKGLFNKAKTVLIRYPKAKTINSKDNKQ